MEKFKEACAAFIQFVAESLRSLALKRQQEQEAARQQQVAYNINQIALSLQGELCDLFQNSPYRFINSIRMPTDIHYQGYTLRQGQYIYSFQVFCEPVPSPVILRQCLISFPQDIYMFQQRILNHMGPQYAQLNYPCMMAGLDIINIKSVGCMIQFDVITRFAP